MQPDPNRLLKKLGLTVPLIGLYDSPYIEPYKPLIKPRKGKRECFFIFYNRWLNGETLHLTSNNYGCFGCGKWIFNTQTRSKEERIRVWVGEEGLKASPELMGKWLDYYEPYKAEYENILIGPLKEDNYQYLKTITFFVNPDQLSLLILGAEYYSAPTNVRIMATYGPGCAELLPIFKDLNDLKAIIGAIDIRLRRYIPADILAFTVTKPMYQQLCEIGDESFFYKRPWKKLRKERGLYLE